VQPRVETERQPQYSHVLVLVPDCAWDEHFIYFKQSGQLRCKSFFNLDPPKIINIWFHRLDVCSVTGFSCRGILEFYFLALSLLVVVECWCTRHTLFFLFTVSLVVVTVLGVINMVFTANTSKIVEPWDLGGLFGLLATSMASIAGIAGPVLGGAVARIHPIHGPLSAVLSLYGVVFTMVYGGYECIVCQNPPRMRAKENLQVPPAY
jgi:MFS family permease